jgi:hypothetical protein
VSTGGNDTDTELPRVHDHRRQPGSAFLRDALPRRTSTGSIELSETRDRALDELIVALHAV